MTTAKVDFTIIKRLVSELEATTIKAEEMKEAGGSQVDFIIEMSKATGLASQISAEGVYLISDIQKIMVGKPEDLLGVKDIFSKAAKGLGGLGGTN